LMGRMTVFQKVAETSKSRTNSASKTMVMSHLLPTFSKLDKMSVLEPTPKKFFNTKMTTTILVVMK